MNIGQATAIAGTLSRPSKMPGLGYGLPAAACRVGGKLQLVPGSVCSGCYALKGNYQFANVQDSQAKRLAGIFDPQWASAMVTLIGRQLGADSVGKRIRGKIFRRFFRWHDSGDIQSPEHLTAIVDIARELPDVAFWLPTKERAVVTRWAREHGQFPRNLTVRVSGAMVDGPVPLGTAQTSTVHGDHGSRADECPAYLQGGECRDCRKCWNDDANISYPTH